jgi:site-specific DNA-methyltransferase (adenine-specific)
MEMELKPYQLLKYKNLNYIFHSQDCLIGIQETILDKSIDIVVTSPPYNIGKDYGKYQDNLSRKIYLAWMDTVFKAIKRVLKKGGSFFLNMGNIPADQWICHDVSSVARRYFTLQNKITWIKNISINKSDVGKNNLNVLRDFSAGHFKAVNSSRFLSNCYEDIFTLPISVMSNWTKKR